MDRIEDTETAAHLPLEAIRDVLSAAPVRLAILFGSAATGRTHPRSDVDIAIELEGLRPGQAGYNDAFLGVGVDLSDVLETDDVDVVDVHSLSGSLARSVFDDGVVLYGDVNRVETLRDRLSSADADDRPPRERFDEALQRIDEHLA